MVPHPWFALWRTAASGRAGFPSAPQARAADGSESRPYQPPAISSTRGQGRGPASQPQPLNRTPCSPFLLSFGLID
jgi:hypothetical protein